MSVINPLQVRQLYGLGIPFTLQPDDGVYVDQNSTAAPVPDGTTLRRRGCDI
jgi:hypothetical protein